MEKYSQKSRNDVQAQLKNSYHEIIRLSGEDVSRAGLIKTPERAAKAFLDLISGYQIDFTKLVNGAVFDSQNDSMVVVKDIEFYSMCEHHLLPFTGKAHVAYLPRDKVIGLSKIPRIVDAFARRLQIQEQMSFQIANQLQSVLNPRGVAVMISAKHSCLSMRGIKNQNASMVSSSLTGAFKECAATREEFFSVIR